MACCTSSMVCRSTATPWPCSPSSGLTTTRWCSSRNSRLSSALPASCCAGSFKPARLERLVGQAFVLAQGHADGAGQVAQRFTAAHAAPAMAEGEQAGIGIVHLHVDAAAMGFFDDDPRVRVEPRLRARAEEQRLVDAVLALDRKGGQGAKAELGVEALGLAVVVQHRQVQVAQATAHEVFHQVAHQHFADARARAVRVDRQAPQAATVFRVVEGFLMVQAHHAADHRAAVLRPRPANTPGRPGGGASGVRRRPAACRAPGTSWLTACQSAAVWTRRIRKPRNTRVDWTIVR